MDTCCAVRDLLHHYCRLADHGRISDIARLFTEDGVFELAGERSQGAVAIEATLAGLAERFADYGSVGRSLRHHLTTLTVSADDDTHVRTYAYVLVVGRDGLDHWGRYRDDVVRGPGGWRFAHRRAFTDGAVPGSVAEPLVGLR